MCTSKSHQPTKTIYKILKNLKNNNHIKRNNNDDNKTIWPPQA